jgi:hypothetical protein
MADLIDILKGKNPQAQDNDGEDLDFIAVQPKITDDTFYSDILEELDAAEIIDFSYINAHQFNFVGSTDGDEDVLGLENGTASFDFEEYKNIFIGYKGSIGRFGSTAIFPFVIDYPDVSNMSDSDITSIFGSDALGGRATPNADSYITIGGGASSTIPLEGQSERIFTETIITVDHFPEIHASIVDFDDVVLHEQNSTTAISISQDRVDIYPAASKRTINLYPCGAGLKMKSKTSADDGSLRDPDSQGACANIMVEKGLLPSNTEFADLIRKE